MSRPANCHGHNTKAFAPLATENDRLENEARDHGWQCRCGYMNLTHRRMCKKCGKRGKPSATMLKQQQKDTV